MFSISLFISYMPSVISFLNDLAKLSIVEASSNPVQSPIRDAALPIPPATNPRVPLTKVVPAVTTAFPRPLPNFASVDYASALLFSI
jgi:hypothetical protein